MNRETKLIPCTRYGKHFFRRSPQKYQDAHTPAQTLQRGRFQAVIAFYQSLNDTFLNNIWKTAAKGQGCSGYNWFIKRNINAFDADGKIADYSKIILSEGTLPLPDGLDAGRNAQNRIEVRWRENSELATLRRHDCLKAAVIYDDNPFEVQFLDTMRTERGDLLTVLQEEATRLKSLHLYLFFCTEGMERFSAQRYFKFE